MKKKVNDRLKTKMTSWIDSLIIRYYDLHKLNLCGLYMGHFEIVCL